MRYVPRRRARRALRVVGRLTTSTPSRVTLRSTRWTVLLPRLTRRRTILAASGAKTTARMPFRRALRRLARRAIVTDCTLSLGSRWLIVGGVITAGGAIV